MDNLRVVLIVVASLVILALLIHGFWINKKERSSLFTTHKKGKNKGATQNELDTASALSPQNNLSVPNSEIKAKKPKTIINDNLVSECDEVELPRQHDLFMQSNFDDNQAQSVINKNTQKEAIEFDINENESIDISLKSTDHLNDKKTLKVQSKIVTIETNTENLNQAPKTNISEKIEQLTTEIIVLNITGLNGNLLQGDVLLGSIIQSGFKFGDMNIFHRYIDPAGNGSLLFSLANMVQPGYLDPETMHEMKTPGISIFMVAPTDGNNEQNFKLMLQTAQRIADDVNGVILDDEHHMLTPQKIDNYKERIKKACNQL